MSRTNQKFLATVEKRVLSILTELRALADLAHKTNNYTADDAKEIVTALETELKLVRQAFLSPKPEAPKFRLSSRKPAASEGAASRRAAPAGEGSGADATF